jgi:hypothetical protein
VPAFVEPVVIDEFVIGALGPTPRRFIFSPGKTLTAAGMDTLTAL